METIGIGKGTVTMEDFEQTDVILMMGINPATNMPRMLDSLEKAKAKGAKIIAINPLLEAGLIGFNDPNAKGMVAVLNKSSVKPLTST